MVRRSASRLGNEAALLVLGTSAQHRKRFLRATGRAARTFELRDWGRLRAESVHRLTLYGAHVDQAVSEIGEFLGDRSDDRVIWVGAKAVYSSLIASRPDWDLAETFFNSVARRMLGTVGVDPLVEFVDTDFDEPPVPVREPAHRSIPWRGSLLEQVTELLREQTFGVPWMDLRGDAARIAGRIEQDATERGVELLPVGLSVLREPFFRGKAAYVVGRLVSSGGPVPLALALRNGPRGLFVDAVLTQEADLSILFSFTRSYFHVATERPFDVVAFLSSLMPGKRRAELYISLGHVKQGKTELFRDLRQRFDQRQKQFTYAPGIPGLVMVCFTMDGWDLVVKVIRDSFPAEKSVSQQEVRDRYRWVHLHDRAGRLVDAQAFTDLRVPRACFEPALLHELLHDCGESVRAERDDIVIGLAYVERRLTPLNIVVRDRPLEEATRAMEGFADALQDLAACNIFPGDLLLKNFGVTRHGRVAFYDYDELVPLDTCNFREIPEAETYEQEMASEPWYSVGPDDVFPEEFPRFLGLPSRLRRTFLADHRELFTADWWTGQQRRLSEGKVVEFVPYREELRLSDPSGR